MRIKPPTSLLATALALAVAALGATAGSASAATISINDAGGVPEGSNGLGGTATFEVTVQHLQGEVVNWTPTVTGGTATPGDDFGAATTGASNDACANGNCTAHIGLTVPIVGDNNNEPSETFQVKLSSPTATVVAGGGNASINDDDPLPQLDVSGTTLTEGNAGSKTAKVEFELKTLSGYTVEIPWATSGGTATPGSDYTPRSGVAKIQPGERETDVEIPVIGDTAVEGDEDFYVNVSAPTHATLDDSSARVTITNDDVAPPAQNTVVTRPQPGGSTPANTSNGAVSVGITTHLPATSGGGATGTGAAGEQDLLGPVMRVGFKGLTSQGKARITVVCPASEPQACSGRVSLSTMLKGQKVSLGSATFSQVASGSAKTVKVALSRRARRALRKAEGFKAKVRASDGNGNVAMTSRSFDV